ncbi:MAG: hypothetical protein LBM78_00625 [Clostridiales bacterium]|jgi:hypothetical protein|nr:hypothetical protein [Clostridiales bacterium]
MEQRVYFCGAYPCGITVDGGFFGVCGTGHGAPVGGALTPGVHFAEVMPLHALPYAFAVTVAADGVEADEADCRRVDFGGGVHELRLVRMPPRGYTPPRVLARAAARQPNAVSAAVVDDGYIRLVLECDGATHAVLLRDGLQNVTVEAKNRGTAADILVRGVCAEGTEVVLVRRQGGFKTLLHEVCDGIAEEGDRLVLTPARGDLAGRASIKTYDLPAGTLASERFAYLAGTPARAEGRAAVVALFEAVRARDFSEAGFYLTDALRTVMTQDVMLDFFEGYGEIADDRYGGTDGFVLVGAHKAVPLVAEFSGGKIANLRQA